MATKNQIQPSKDVTTGLLSSLAEIFDALEEISRGNPDVRISEASDIGLISELKHVVNATAENLGEIVDLSHEFAIGLAEHFDVLHRASQGDSNARISGTSKIDLLESLKSVTNRMIENVFREIIEHKRTEERLLTSHQALRELIVKVETAKKEWEATVDCMGGMVLLADDEGKVQRCNNAFMEFTAKPYEKILGRFWVDALQGHQILVAIVNRSTIELHDQRMDKWFEVNTYEFENSVGALRKGTVITIHETTELKHMAQDLKKKNEQIEKNQKELEKAYSELKTTQAQIVHQEKMASVGQLAAGIAHEINTPTQYVGDNTRFLRDAFGDIQNVLDQYNNLLQCVKTKTGSDRLTEDIETSIHTLDIAYLKEEIPKAISQSLEGLDRISHIVRAMKEFSHPGTEEKTPTDINKAIDNTITVSRNQWKYVADMKTEFDENLPPVPCIPGAFNQVILNLVTNAAHAVAEALGENSGSKGTITIRTTREADWVVIAVSDTGPGIPEAIRPRIFDLFFTTKEVGKGTGQGLAICNSIIVDKHGGTVDYQTEIGKGTTFFVRLPLVIQPPPSDGAAGS